jgi:hypothetical protein
MMTARHQAVGTLLIEQRADRTDGAKRDPARRSPPLAIDHAGSSNRRSRRQCEDALKVSRPRPFGARAGTPNSG